MAYSGQFSPRNTNKYLGDPTNIWYTSLWDRQVMVHLDNNINVVGWSNEELVIPYLSPVDNRWHRYFPDFFVKVKNREGIIESLVLEVKPKSQAKPPQIRGRVTKKYINEVVTWGINEAKWNAAIEYCKDRNWKFKIITQDNLNI